MMTTESTTTESTATEYKTGYTGDLTLGDILKSEADINSRTWIKGDDVKIGDTVTFGAEKRSLIALSNSEFGKVLVQPFNCVMNVDFLGDSGDLDTLNKDGGKYGIKYITTANTHAN